MQVNQVNRDGDGDGAEKSVRGPWSWACRPSQASGRSPRQAPCPSVKANVGNHGGHRNLRV
jgi:hypothetical protein